MFDGNSPYSAFRTDCWGYCTTLHDEDASFKFGIKKRLTSGPPSPRQARITLLALIWSRPLLIIERNNIRNGGPTGRDMNKTESEATHAAFSAPQEAQHSHRECTHHVCTNSLVRKGIIGVIAKCWPACLSPYLLELYVSGSLKDVTRVVGVQPRPDNLKRNLTHSGNLTANSDRKTKKWGLKIPRFHVS